MHLWRDVLPWAWLTLATIGCEIAETADDSPPVRNPSDPLVERLDQRPCPKQSQLSYEAFGGPFIITWCNGCHASGLPDAERQGAPLGIDFDDVAAVRLHAARIWARSADHNVTMPPVGGPELEERELLGDWLACNAPTLADIE